VIINSVEQFEARLEDWKSRLERPVEVVVEGDVIVEVQAARSALRDKLLARAYQLLAAVLEIGQAIPVALQFVEHHVTDSTLRNALESPIEGSTVLDRRPERIAFIVEYLQ